MSKNLELYHLKKFKGYQRQLLTIHEAIRHPRESVVINITGAYGSGRSSILHYIKSQVENKEWFMPQTKDPFVAYIQGQSYDKQKDSFLGFLARELNVIIDNEYSEIMNKIEFLDEEDSISMMIEKLRWLTNEDYPVIIMIDNFDRIMERIKPVEAQNLNRLRIGGLHYIFVTNSRSIHEIAPGLRNISDFFRTVQIVSFPPLISEDVKELISQVLLSLNSIYKKDYKISDSGYKIVEALAGGHPALVVNVVQCAFFDKSSANSYKLDCEITEEDLEKESFLNYLPEDETINYYLDRLISVISEIPLSLSEIEFLVDIAMSAEISNSKILNKPKTLMRFRTMGLIRDSHDIEINGKLIQYAILRNVIPQQFSDAEQVIVNYFLKVCPGLVPFSILEELSMKFTDHDDNSETLRRFVDSTIARIRKKISAIPNNASLKIDNVRGEGFYITSGVSFRSFCLNDASVFIKAE